MSIKIIHDRDASRPAFHCDRCDRPITIEEGIFVWNWTKETGDGPSRLLCRKCDDLDDCKMPLTQDLPTGLIYLLVQAGWLDGKFRPTAKLLQAGENARLLATI